MTAQPLPDEQLAAIQARADAAHPGPWHREDSPSDLNRWVTSEDGMVEINLGYLGNSNQADADFVAHAREDVPTLLAENEVLRALVRDLARTDPCGLDHHGYCQEHWWFDSSPCPHGVAQRAGLVHDDTDQDAELHDAPGRERIGEWASSIATWAAEVVQPEPDRLRAERDRYRAAWNSARHRANHNHLQGARFPGGAVREALVHAGYITRRDTVAEAVQKLNDAPRTWYVRWLSDRLLYIGRAYASTVLQAQRQARRADQAEAERDTALAQVAEARQFADEMAGYCSPHGIAADYARRLTAALDRAADPTTT